MWVYYDISRKAYFSAAHHLEGYDGKCAEVHGHNFCVEATLKLKKRVVADHIPSYLEKNSGIAIDFGELKIWLNELCADLDHKDLNQVFGVSPTAENLAMFFASQIANKARVHFMNAQFELILESATANIWENEKSCVAVTIPC